MCRILEGIFFHAYSRGTYAYIYFSYHSLIFNLIYYMYRKGCCSHLARLFSCLLRCIQLKTHFFWLNHHIVTTRTSHTYYFLYQTTLRYFYLFLCFHKTGMSHLHFTSYLISLISIFCTVFGPRLLSKFRYY